MRYGPITESFSNDFSSSVKLGKLVRFSAEASWQEDGQALAPSGAGVSQACYVARLDGEFPARDEEYSIVDDFEQRWYKLRRPSMLCLASHAPGTTPGNADAHRMCYLARRGWGESKHEPVTGIGTHDTFGELTVDTRTESLVCTPALVAFGD